MQSPPFSGSLQAGVPTFFNLWIAGSSAAQMMHVEVTYDFKGDGTVVRKEVYKPRGMVGRIALLLVYKPPARHCCLVGGAQLRGLQIDLGLGAASVQGVVPQYQAYTNALGLANETGAHAACSQLGTVPLTIVPTRTCLATRE